MANIQMLSVRLPAEDLENLDQLASIQDRPRSQLTQEPLSGLIRKNNELRSLELALLQKRLQSSIKEQCGLLDTAPSFSDEHRRFGALVKWHRSK